MATEAGSIFVRVLADTSQFMASMGRVNSTLMTMNGTTSTTGAALGKARSNVTAFGGSAQTAGKQAAGAGSSFKGMAGGMLGALGVISGFTLGRDAIKMSAEFDQAMRNVNSIARLPEKQLNKLRKELLAMAGPAGQAPAILARGLYDLVSSGFSANDAVKILASSSKAATAGLTDTATSTKAIVAGLNAYHLGAGKARKVSDILFRTVDRGVLTFEELSQNMGDLVPIAAPLGVRLEEVGAAMSTLTLQGVPTAEAATRVKNVMIQLASPSKELSKLLLKSGFASGEAAVKSRGFVGVLRMLDKATGGNVTKTAKLTPEIRSLMGVVGLTGKNFKTYKENLVAMERAQEGAGATAEVFKEQSKGLQTQWNKFSAGLKADTIPAIREMEPAFSAAMQIVGDAFPVALAGLQLSLSPFTGTLKGIAALLRGDWSGAWRVALSPVTAFKDLISKVATAVGLDVGKIGGFFAGLPGKIAGTLGDLGTTALSPFKSAFTTAKDWVHDKVSDIVGFFGALPGRLWGAFSSRWPEVKAAMFKPWVDLAHWVGDRVSDVVGFFRGLPDRIASTLGDLARTALNPFRSAFTSVRDLVRARVDEVVGFFRALPGKLSGFVDAIGAAAGKIGSAIVGGLSSALGAAERLIGLISQIKSLGGIFSGGPSIPSGGGGGGGGFDWLQGRAKGGSVSAGRAYLVGERGPELFSPGMAGRIIPNERLAIPSAAAAGAAPLVVNITVKGSLIHERELGATVVRAVQDWSRLNGPIVSRTAFASA